MTFRGMAPSRTTVAFPRPAAIGVLRLAQSTLRGLFRLRPPDASDLSDRHLADIGLTRADLPDHRGWRR